MLEGSILRKLIRDRTTRDQTPLNFGVYYKNTLVALCHALEDFILAADCSPLVLTAFQRGKWYLQEADRYSEIADKARQIVIMAASEAGFHSHPTSQRQNVSLVDLTPDDPVAQEWHLIIYSPNYTAMVLCQELSAQDYGPNGPPENDLERKFYGLWTFEPALVRETVDLAIAHIGSYDADLQSQLQAHQDAITQAQEQTHVNAHLGHAVTQVVNYLQGSRQSLLGSQALSLAEDLDQNLISNELQAFLRMAQLVDLSDPLNPLAASEVSSLLEMMGQLLDLPAWRLRRLRLAGMLHRIAPLESDIALSPEVDSPSCPLVPGAQVLRTMPRLRAVATIITHLSEAWDGSGQPAHLAGDQIPLESRMLGLVSCFQQRLADYRRQAPDPEADPDTWLGQALADCQAEKGQRWDPKLMEILALMVSGLQQGLSLPALPSRISLSTGLLSPDVDELTGQASDRSTNLLTS